MTGAQHGFGCGRGALARKVRRDIDARLGTDQSRRREWLHRRRRAASRHRLRRNGRALESRTNKQLQGTTAPKNARIVRDRADWTQPLVFSKADPRALYYASQFFTRARRREDVDADQRRSHARRSGRAAELDAIAAAHVDRNGKRGVIYTIAPSPIRCRALGRHRQRGDQAHGDDGRTCAERDAGGDHGVEPRDDDRGVALRHERRVRAASTGTSCRLEPYIYRTRDAGKTLAADRDAASPRRVRAHGEGRSENAGTLVAGTERGALQSIDDGETGSRYSSISQSRPCATSRSTITTSLSARTAAASG